jgi:hypothetical protein
MGFLENTLSLYEGLALTQLIFSRNLRNSFLWGKCEPPPPHGILFAITDDDSVTFSSLYKRTCDASRGDAPFFCGRAGHVRTVSPFFDFSCAQASAQERKNSPPNPNKKVFLRAASHFHAEPGFNPVLGNAVFERWFGRMRLSMRSKPVHHFLPGTMNANAVFPSFPANAGDGSGGFRKPCAIQPECFVLGALRGCNTVAIA